MKAVEIRERQAAIKETIESGPATEGQGICFWLSELAAQLAQLNENVFALTNDTVKVMVETGNYPLEVNTHERR